MFGAGVGSSVEYGCMLTSALDAGNKITWYLA